MFSFLKIQIQIILKNKKEKEEKLVVKLAYSMQNVKTKKRSVKSME